MTTMIFADLTRILKGGERKQREEKKKIKRYQTVMI
jgi:hypothetical protein